MATEIMKLTAEIIVSHASMSEISPQQLIEEIKEVYATLASLETGVIPGAVAPRRLKKLKG